MNPDCKAELCRHWTGSGCLCTVFDLDPVVPCEYVLRLGTRTDPPERCDRDSVPGEELCSFHRAMTAGEFEGE